MKDCKKCVSIDTVSDAMKKRGFEISHVATLEDAGKLFLNNILPASGSKSIAFGGSTTIEKMNIVEELKKNSELNVIDTYDKSDGTEAQLERRRRALLTDMFLTSANAISGDGRVFLLDYYGNRTAAVQFGPKKVVLVVSKNKITSDAHSAFARVRNVAAPANNKRLNLKNPCIKAGKCMDCSSDTRICAVWTIVDRVVPKGRIHVILVDEEVGF